MKNKNLMSNNFEEEQINLGNEDKKRKNEKKESFTNNKKIKTNQIEKEKKYTSKSF
jgi:hypothetical protein